MGSNKLFSLPQAAAAMGVSPKVLRNWQDRGFLDRRPAFTRDDLARAISIQVVGRFVGLDEAARLLMGVFRKQRPYWAKHTSAPSVPLWVVVNAPTDVDEDPVLAEAHLYAGIGLADLTAIMELNRPAHWANEKPSVEPLKPRNVAIFEIGNHIKAAFERLALALATPAPAM
jgi:hypothetical protein